MTVKKKRKKTEKKIAEIRYNSKLKNAATNDTQSYLAVTNTLFGVTLGR